MKNSLIILAFIMFAGISVFAQTSGTVNINITLHPIQILKINPAQTEVDLTYTDEDDYKNGVRNLQENHLTIFSTSGYEVSVFSDYASSSSGEAEVQPPSFQIAALLPDAAAGGINVSNIHLLNYKQNIISSNRPDFGINFDVEYQGLGDNSYLKHLHSENLETTVHRTKVTYSLEVK